MFCPLGYRDSMIIFRGIVMLAIIIFLGVGAAEKQINSLTARQENVLAFALDYQAKGIYTILINGSSYQLSAIYEVGELINKDSQVVLKTKQGDIVIPKYIEFDCKKELDLLDAYIRKIEEKLDVYIKAYR